MNKLVIEKRIRDWSWRDWLSGSTTVLLWLSLGWVFIELFAIPLKSAGIAVPSLRSMPLDDVIQALLFLLELILIAYLLSITFLFWRWLTTFKQPPPVPISEVADSETARFFGVSLSQIESMRKQKTQVISVTDIGHLQVVIDTQPSVSDIGKCNQS